MINYCGKQKHQILLDISTKYYYIIIHAKYNSMELRYTLHCMLDLYFATATLYKV